MKNKTIAWIVYILFLIVTAFLSKIIDMNDWWCVPFLLGVFTEVIFLSIKNKDEN